MPDVSGGSANSKRTSMKSFQSKERFRLAFECATEGRGMTDLTGPRII